jgi:hypothetical protein
MTFNKKLNNIVILPYVSRKNIGYQLKVLSCVEIKRNFLTLRKHSEIKFQGNPHSNRRCSYMHILDKIIAISMLADDI